MIMMMTPALALALALKHFPNQFRTQKISQMEIGF